MLNVPWFTVIFTHIFHSTPITGTLKTAALLMRAIDRKKYHAESLEFIGKLKEYDPHRRGYYQDLSNKWSIEDRLEDWINAVSMDRDTPIDLSQLNLINLHYKQYVCVADKIDLTGNQLDARRINELSALLESCNVNFTFDPVEDQ